jgi:hypothetical protein
MLSIWAVRAHVAGAIVHQSMSDHFVLALEPFAAFTARTLRDRTEVGPCGAVHVLMRAGKRSASLATIVESL